MKLPLSKTLFVLIGFPLISTLLSLLLLKRSLFSDLSLDFFNTFWIIITAWYILQIYLVYKILKSSGYTFADIGYAFNTKRTLIFCLVYLFFATALLIFVEYVLANGNVNHEKLQKILSLSPKNTEARIIFIFMAMTAGFSEEIVYRGFVIKALVGHKINKWVAVAIACIPFILQHGIKAYQTNWAIWYLVWGFVFGGIFLFFNKLYVNMVLHWVVILSALVAILQAVE